MLVLLSGTVVKIERTDRIDGSKLWEFSIQTPHREPGDLISLTAEAGPRDDLDLICGDSIQVHAAIPNFLSGLTKMMTLKSAATVKIHGIAHRIVNITRGNMLWTKPDEPGVVTQWGDIA